MNSKQEKRINISLRLPETVVERADQRAKELNVSRTDIVEKALRCFLGVATDEQCSTYSEIEKIQNQIKRLVELNSLKLDIE